MNLDNVIYYDYFIKTFGLVYFPRSMSVILASFIHSFPIYRYTEVNVA